MSNTQSNSSNNTKTVLYYGKEFEVPVEQKYIHTDSIGAVYTSTLECTRGCTKWYFVEGSARARVGSFNHTEMSTINWMQSQKHIQDLIVPYYLVVELVPELEPTRHPHADWMLKYAQIAQHSDKPWEEFELYNTREQAWVQNSTALHFHPALQYRLKPQSVKPEVQVGQVWESSKALVKFNVLHVRECCLTNTKYIELSYDLDVGLSIPYTVTEDTLRKHFRLVK